MWVVKYSTGSYDDFYTVNVFVTTNEETAQAYCEKFNRILTKWKDYWDTIVNEDNCLGDDEYNFHRWCRISGMNLAYYDKIQIR